MRRKEYFLDTLAEAGQLERLLTCLEFSKALLSAYDMETLLTQVLERIKALIPARNWSLLLVDPQTQELYFAVVVGVDPESLRGLRLQPGEGVAGAVVTGGKPICIQDASKDHRFSSRADLATGFDTRSIIALPLLVRGEVIGVFEVVNVEDEKYFKEKYLPLLAILADYVAIAVDNVHNLQRLQARTYIDEVTGFYNPRYLACKLDHLLPLILEKKEYFSVAFLDLDDFKHVVDTHGHLLGSQILGEVARVIHAVLRPDDSLVRYGGDEFIILMPQTSQEEALAVVRRLRRAINSSLFLQKEEISLRLTASYGIATLPQDAQDRETLLRIADRAMFRSKGRGKDGIMVGQDLTPAAVE
ncbi:MAG: sensor domain-containing diguanylate cyclase [Syntrophales bacterium]|nr:sensor domain-containing diguanylate cyclase [Syntrophales bacterium]MDD5643155.1 sensor domain-containing diguanylate cyclase [Syntrophales bacterium]